MRAVLNGTVIAESHNTEIVEGNHYFPADSIKSELFTASDTHTVCPWKGTASYYTVTVDGQTHEDVAWFYPAPKDAAAQIAGYVAFYPQVTIED